MVVGGASLSIYGSVAANTVLWDFAIPGFTILLFSGAILKILALQQ